MRSLTTGLRKNGSFWQFLAALSLLLLPETGFTQSQEEDNAIYKASVEWLNRKLNYVYYDKSGQKWWTNSFSINDEKIVTIKNISSTRRNTANIKDKTYLIRRFRLRDINPDNIVITQVKEDHGRIVKGILLELHTFSNSKTVEKTTNGRRGSNTSFVQISFPEVLLDSISNYPELVKTRFMEAIISTTRIHSSPDFEENANQVFQSLSGKFLNEDNEVVELIENFPYVRSFSSESEIVFLGLNEKEASFYLATIMHDGMETENYKLAETGHLLLQNTAKAGDSIVIETPNRIWFRDQFLLRE